MRDGSQETGGLSIFKVDNPLVNLELRHFVSTHAESRVLCLTFDLKLMLWPATRRVNNRRRGSSLS